MGIKRVLFDENGFERGKFATVTLVGRRYEIILECLLLLRLKLHIHINMAIASILCIMHARSHVPGMEKFIGL